MIKGLVKELFDSLEIKDGMDEDLSQEKFEDMLDEPKVMVIVAEVNDKVIGYLTLNFNKSLLDAGDTAIIDELVVNEKERGKGVGRMLIDYAIEICKHSGCSEVGVGTEFGNMKAQRFYDKCDFKAIGLIFEKLLG
jgi:GNAT superfamily N-acetyltransferase